MLNSLSHGLGFAGDGDDETIAPEVFAALAGLAVGVQAPIALCLGSPSKLRDDNTPATKELLRQGQKP